MQIRVKVDELKPSVSNVRSKHSKEDIQMMADSITHRGIINPPSVAKNGDGRYEVVRRCHCLNTKRTDRNLLVRECGQTGYDCDAVLRCIQQTVQSRYACRKNWRTLFKDRERGAAVARDRIAAQEIAHSRHSRSHRRRMSSGTAS